MIVSSQKKNSKRHNKNQFVDQLCISSHVKHLCDSFICVFRVHLLDILGVCILHLCTVPTRRVRARTRARHAHLRTDPTRRGMKWSPLGDELICETEH